MDMQFKSHGVFGADAFTWSKALDWWITEQLEPQVRSTREMVLAVDRRLGAVERYLGWDQRVKPPTDAQVAAPKAPSCDQGRIDVEAENRRLSRVVAEQAEAIRSIHLQMEHVRTELEDQVQSLQARLNKKRSSAKKPARVR